MNDYEKNSAQKLADTLKRCGLASSVSQAHMMAGSITTTEKKVQTFFDQKKKEMKDDLMKSVHPHREDVDNGKESPMLKKAKETVAFSLEKKEEAKAEAILESPKVEVYYEHHDEIIKKEENAELKEEPKIMVITSDKHDEILNSAEPLKDAVKEDTGKNEDYINKYINAEESPAVEKEDMEQKIQKLEPEKKVEAPKPSLPPKSAYQSSTMGPHPKTGSSYGVSLESYFNYGKRAK